MTRRHLAFLAPLILAALVGLWLTRTRVEHTPDLPTTQGSPQGEAPLASAPQPEREATGSAGGRELQFEPLTDVPADLIVRFRDATTFSPVADAEVFLLEVEEYGWPSRDLESDHAPADFEADLRARGRSSRTDAGGAVRVPAPRFPLRICGRKGDLFGAQCLGEWDLSAATVWLFRSRECLVRVLDAQGRTLPRAGVEIGSPLTDAIWRARCDDRGECRIANLGWILCLFGPGDGWWYAAAGAADSTQPARWFRAGEPPPGTIDLVQAVAGRLVLRLAASDGTPLPMGGTCSTDQGAIEGDPVPRSPRGNRRSLPIRRGVVSVECGEPGSWITCCVELDGGAAFQRSIRVPRQDAGLEGLQLNVPESVQLLLLHPTDAQGAPCTNTEFDWIVRARLEEDGLEHERRPARVRSDQEGLVVLAVAREFWNDGRWSDARGRLCRGSGDESLESPPVPLSVLGASAARDLGKLALDPAEVLARGRVVDDLGRPVPRVRVGVKIARMQNGRPSLDPGASPDMRLRASTDAEGRFLLRGTLPNRMLLVDVQRQGFSTPRDVPPAWFDSASHPDLSLRLVRNGEVRTSVQVPSLLPHKIRWHLSSASGAGGVELGPSDGTGLLERDIHDVPPGTYRARLLDCASDETLLLEVDDVVVRTGERTLDPRLRGIDLSACARFTDTPAPRGGEPGSILLSVVDEHGRQLDDGRLVLNRSGGASSTDWHAGQVFLDPDMRGKEIAVWSAGYRAWIGPCPDISQVLRLAPAGSFTIRLEIPPALNRPLWRFRIRPWMTSGSATLTQLATLLMPVVVDADGFASFECPFECSLNFDVQVLALDPSGSGLRAGTSRETLTSAELRLQAGAPVQVISAGSEQWAALEKALGDGR
jgi:hypothetical protein